MAKLGKYDVEIEYLDEQGNVFDSSCVLMTDSYEEAEAEAQKVELHSDREQVSIWEWDDDETIVEESWVVKEFEKK